MLTYLLGDILRLMSGDMQPGTLFKNTDTAQNMWALIAILMSIPILMIVLSAILRYPWVKRVNLLGGVCVILFNLLGLPYEAFYDNFLIGISLIFNTLILWYAWKWKSHEEYNESC